MKFLEKNGGNSKTPAEAVLDVAGKEREKPVDRIELKSYIRAGYSLIYIRTEEDHRAIELVKSSVQSLPSVVDNITYGEWKSTTGLLMANAPGEFELDADQTPKAQDIFQALQYIIKADSDENPPSRIICYHNIRYFMTNFQVVQQLKDSAYKARLHGSHIVLIGADLEIPPELTSLVTVYDLDLPDQEHFKALFTMLSDVYSNKIEKKPSSEDIEAVAASAVGMTELQGENAIALSIVDRKKLSQQIVQIEKEQAIKRSDVLEFIHNLDTMDDVGGFKVLKEWVNKRRDAFSPEAMEYGLKFPKGVLLVGIPGTGKSLSARAISNYLRLPLLKLDVGRIFKSLQGSSEARVRGALKTAEAVAPVILWVEEIEKSMAGSQSSGQTDSGTTARVMSTILTWMQENTKPVFIVATANNVEALPPELLRKGRFSEIFGVIEPNDEERKEVWKIHVRKVRPERVDEFDYDLIVTASKGYTGAEIETIVEEAMYDAWDDGRREMETADILSSINNVVPQATTSKERINVIRQWMKTRVRFVSDEATTVKDKKDKTDDTWRKIHSETVENPEKDKLH